MKYDAAHFIDKFMALPDAGFDPMLACGISEGAALRDLFGSLDALWRLDNPTDTYPQPTVRLRALAALCTIGREQDELAARKASLSASQTRASVIVGKLVDAKLIAGDIDSIRKAVQVVEAVLQ